MIANLIQTLCLQISTRFACESWLAPFISDTKTPSRVSAWIHGALSCLYLLEGNWKDPIVSSGLFFASDLLLTKWFRQSLPLDMIAHHLLGGVLCLYSALTESYEEPHFGKDLTRALILLETTNPLLHALVTLRKEHLETKLPSWLLRAFQHVFFAQFTIVRIGILGKALVLCRQNLKYATSMQLGMFWMGAAMWILQWIWFVKLFLVAAAIQRGQPTVT